MPSPLLPDNDGHALSIRRYESGFEHSAVHIPPDLRGLCVLDPPEPVARATRRQVKQGRPPETRGERPARRHRERVELRLAFLGLTVEDRHTPERGAGVGHGGDDARAVTTRCDRRELIDARGHAPRQLAIDIQGPQPWTRPIRVASHIEERVRIDWREEIAA